MPLSFVNIIQQATIAVTSCLWSLKATTAFGIIVSVAWLCVLNKDTQIIYHTNYVARFNFHHDTIYFTEFILLQISSTLALLIAYRILQWLEYKITGIEETKCDGWCNERQEFIERLLIKLKSNKSNEKYASNNTGYRYRNIFCTNRNSKFYNERNISQAFQQLISHVE